MKSKILKRVLAVTALVALPATALTATAAPAAQKTPVELKIKKS